MKKSMFFIFVLVFIFSSCTGDKVQNVQVEQQEYIAVGSLYCENSQRDNETAPNENNLNTVMVVKELAATYKEMLLSNTFLGQICENIEGIYTQEELSGMVNIINKGDDILVIEVTADNSDDSLSVCESIFELAPDFVEQITGGNGSVAVLEEPAIR